MNSTGAETAAEPATPAAGPGTSAESEHRLLPRVSWYVRGTVFNRPCKFVVDKGAVLTIVRRGLIKGAVQASPAVRMRNAGTDAPPAALYGPRRVSFEFQGVLVRMSVYEADIHEDCLLGGDFIAAHVRQFDYDTDTMVLRDGDKRVQLTRETRQPEAEYPALSVRVQTVSRMVLQPRTVHYVPVTVRDIDLCGLGEEDPTQVTSAAPGEPALVTSAAPGEGDRGDRTRQVSPGPDMDGLATHSCREGCGQPSASAPLPPPADETIYSVRALRTEVSPSGDLKLGLCVSDELLTVNDKLYIQVANLSNKRRILKRSSCVAELNILSELPANQCTASSTDPPDELPRPLLNLLEQCDGLTSEQQSTVRKLLLEFRDIFSCHGEIGHCKSVQHDIDTGDHVPIKQAPRRLDFHKQGIADTCIKEMLEREIIRPSQSPWASPVVLLTKKDAKPRFAIDFRRLNSITRKDAYPLPRVDQTLDSLRGASWFSSLDLRWGYWNIPLSKEAIPKTAFCVPGHGLYEFLRLPFGLCNAPARVMDQLLPHDMTRVYLDDVIIPGTSFSEELERIRTVFGKVREANFLLNPEKCSLFKRKLEYLGHIISADGVSTDPKKTEKVRNWPTPTDRAQLHSFLGLALYYSRFVKNFACLAAPLHRLTSKNSVFQWTPEAQASFDALRAVLCSPPVLGFPDPRGGPFVLDCDASQVAIGAVLSQVQNGEERVLAYFSEVLSKSRRNYCVTKKELYAIVRALKHFHHYLTVPPFIVRTDHAALQWLRTLRDSVEGQLARWLERLEAYHFSVIHRAGKLHTNADALSRRPCDEDCRHCSTAESNAPEVAVNRTRVYDADCPTRRELRVAQATDLDIAPILRAKQRGERPSRDNMSDCSTKTKALWLQWDSLDIKDGFLCRRFEDTRSLETIHQVVVPYALVGRVLRHFHDQPGSGGHLGVNKTLKKIRQQFYWVGMCQDAHLCCMSCALCRSKKGPRHKPRAPLRRYNVGVPWERVAVDMAGPYPTTPRGNKYLLVALDYFTRWPEAVPVPSMRADVARALVDHVFTRFGPPAELHSDQGRTFESDVLKSVLQLMGTRKTRTTPLHPQSDGAVEKLIGSLIRQLSIVDQSDQINWDLQVPLVLLSFRAAPHTTTGVSPAMLMFGRDMNLPPVFARGLPPSSAAPPSPRCEYPAWLRDRLHHLHHSTRERVNYKTLRMKERYDLRAKRPVYSVGSLVWLYDPRRRVGRAPKLESWWKGPYKVISVINDVVVKLQLDNAPRSRPRTVHVDRVSPMIPRIVVNGV